MTMLAALWANAGCAQAQSAKASAAIDVVSLYFIWIGPCLLNGKRGFGPLPGDPDFYYNFKYL
ncbi:hypothetical protein [Novosphingobium album (ex Hu et al. 2023)]|uniref:Uncharacterized protein n=1 Tax=Novosphingobium album (ex Hu et al. 2023) TaxID=2930093 RepID=A0ABT0AZW5_9SPHN|nr:hypothetical protein [Novosphingobium album (ex Hu et al. 2023)]MCJ2178185.1 hypothetical protein [Novosphingobium album (ex Hu et al. 2023)]